ncbi:hypothetical protein DXG03_006113 [Asterophora parasitica]|uniref:RWD domain-containing protein n=1 Tax=Asterophora parasitica TaxID=117018 RepID=A0A9P7GCS8_9AGAR|nr:hypothetical protein DXG03_006113 [Asterophora parasitica]
MAATNAECESLQHEEYEVLESIYPECISSEITDKSLRLDIPVEFNVPRRVRVVQDGSSPSTSDADAEITLSLSSLPSLMLSVILPPSYPLESPPNVTSIRASHIWLPHVIMSRLQRLLAEMWQPGEGVLYAWIEFLRNGEFLKSLAFEDDTQAIRIFHPSPRILAKLLADSDASAKTMRFTHNSYPCAICLSSFKGSKHGPITACPIAHSEKLVLEYLKLEEGSIERERIERRFGKANVLRLVRQYEEEQANKEWLETSTMACPGCEVYVEKSLGCNHVGAALGSIGARLRRATDDMHEMPTTFLLPVRDEAGSGGPVHTFFYDGTRVLQQAV